jgi:hypothetical protein
MEDYKLRDLSIFKNTVCTLMEVSRLLRTMRTMSRSLR